MAIPENLLIEKSIACFINIRYTDWLLYSLGSSNSRIPACWIEYSKLVENLLIIFVKKQRASRSGLVSASGAVDG